MRRGLAALLLAGCARAPAPSITVPHAVLTDEASERVHARCEVRAVRMLPRDGVDGVARAYDATFTEIVYQPDARYVGVVLFRCPR